MFFLKMVLLDSSQAVVGTLQSSVQWEDTKLEPRFTCRLTGLRKPLTALHQPDPSP
ncbi:hypothetical protein SynMEDNS5_00644 [Synechococcus sp. MEDNS5]|nr:hypothetical protein SynMEDNS5_00644 [Synechococcus sp. MEDNS5]